MLPILTLPKAAIRAAEQDLKRLGKAVSRAKTRALNRAVEQARNEASRDVRQTLNVTASHVKEKMELIKAQKGRNIAGMRVARERLVGTRFVGARWLKRGGFAFTPRKDRPREVWPEAFRHEHKKIKEGKYYLPFRRIGRARYPITVITGPSLLDIYQPLHEKTMERALELLASNLEHEISRAFGG